MGVENPAGYQTSCGKLISDTNYCSKESIANLLLFQLHGKFVIIWAVAQQEAVTVTEVDEGGEGRGREGRRGQGQDGLEVCLQHRV